MPDHISGVIGEVLKACRREHQLTQMELALRSGVDRAFIGHIEIGSKNPSLNTLEKLAGSMNMKASDVLRRAESMAEELPLAAETVLEYGDAET